MKIRDLPAEVYFEYSAATQDIIYEGSDVLDLITADVVDGGVPIIGRAHEAHLRVEGLPVDIRLTFATGRERDVFSACAGDIDDAGVCHPTGEIDFVSLTALGAPETMPVLEGTPIRAEGFDGLVYVDRHDDDSGTSDPIGDAFAIDARVRDLQSFTFTDADLSDVSGPRPHLLVCTSRRDLAGDLVRGNRHDLWVEMIKGGERFVLDYEAPPHRMAFDLSVSSNNAGKSSVEFEYAGSEVGTWAEVRTDIGSMEELKLVLTELPAGDPTIDFCVMNGSLGCAPPTVCYSDTHTPCGPTQDCSYDGVDCVNIDIPADSYNEFSMSLDATGPITVNGHFKQNDDMRLFLENVSIDQGVTLAKFTRTRGFWEGQIDSNVVYGDTHGGTIAGTIKLRHTNWTGTSDRALYVVLPPGEDRFYAIQRYVEIETEGVNGSRNWGQAHCPSGTVLEAESTGIDFDVTDDICREP